MSQDTDFQAYLVALAGVAVQENAIAETTSEPRVWWQRSSGEVDLFLSGSPLLYDTTYDVEVSGEDIDATATIADSLKASLHGFKGLMGSTRVLGMFVSEHSDDYVFKTPATNTDDGFNVFAFRVQILS